MKKTLLMLALLAITATALAYQPKEGVDYDRISPPPPVGSGDKVEVLEFFMYTCPHCNHLEPELEKWRKQLPDYVDFEPVPAMFGGIANLHARAFFALQAMGEAQRLHEAFFKEIHEKHNRLKNREAIEKFLEKHGVDLEKFRQAFDSFAVQTKANRAAALMRRYGIRAVPALVVDGRYRIKNGPKVLEVTDALIQRTLAERKEK
jgi:thiol:disulfide interchange protein DsbA